MFKRKYELDRHMKKHRKEKTYGCTAHGSGRRGHKTFYRLDKLNDHINSAHDEQTRFTCPAPGCRIDQLTKDSMKVHCSKHTRFIEDTAVSDSLRMWYRLEVLPCPMQSCHKIYWSPGHLLEHLRTHTEEERTAQSAAIAAAGYDAITCEVVCPMCDRRCLDHHAFADHLEVNHLLNDGECLLQWKGCLAPPERDESRNVWEKWYCCHGKKGESVITCPTCGSFFWVGRWNEMDHYLTFLTPNEQIYPYRREILRLLPEFQTHPVFDDLRPTTAGNR